MNRMTKLWVALGAVLLGTFFLMGFFGREIYRQAPPLPARVVTSEGRELMTRESILDGQQVWQSIGGQQVGSIWGHGAYQAPDWSADWLHREAVALLDVWAHAAHGAPFASLTAEQQAPLERRLRAEMRTNTYDAATGVLRVSAERAQAMATVAQHYLGVFGDAPELDGLRKAYALQTAPVPDALRRERMTHFFFWTAWAAAAERPGTGASYTNNWPHEPLVGNHPTAANIVWSILSVVVLLAGVGALVWYNAWRRHEEALPPPPAKDPFGGLTLTPSMKAVMKYCLVVVALLLVQVLMGAATAHYTVEGQDFFGIPLAKWLPYSVTRTWHLQLSVFWIATAFLAAGLFLAPAVGGHEPRFQRLGVNVLFGALVLVVGGSMVGEWLAVQQVFASLDVSYLLGHQGYEYVELGRVWQAALFVGLLLWTVLMLRALWPALRRPGESRPIVVLFTGAAVAIGLFYGAGLAYGARTHLSVMEFWRWWVVHLWVEGFMEVFATAATAFLFTRFGLLRPGSAATAVLFSTCIFLLGGVPGTFHHLYFSGTPTSILAVGASFSALEVVPLVLIGAEAFETYRMQHVVGWMARYRWSIRFLVSVAFWNLVGAGLLGFLINPPVALYYMQGLNLTPVHGHAALFGVYGMLALGLVLTVLRWLKPEAAWNERALSVAFWGMNGGLVLMLALSVLPVGLLQTWASIEQGMWYARSADFLQQPLLQNLRWLRMVGDSVFMVGVLALGWFVVGLFRRPSSERVGLVQPGRRPLPEPVGVTVARTQS